MENILKIKGIWYVNNKPLSKCTQSEKILFDKYIIVKKEQYGIS